MTYPIPGPLFCYRPPHAVTHGDIAAGVARDLGWDPDPQQQWFLDAIFAEDDDELPASGEVAIVGPRQTVGKTAMLEAAAITDITVFDQPLHVWTAHEFRTSRKAYLDMRGRLDGHPDYRDRVKYRDAHGEEAIYFELGGGIEFHARSGGSGRGFTTSRITLDEWLFGRAGDLGALAPTLVTMPDAQVRYGSSAGKPVSESLRGIRNRGRNPEPGETLAYIEFGAERRACEWPACPHELGTEGCALNDRGLWWQGNSGLWYGRVTWESMAKQRRMLAAAPAEFVREFYSWWEDPPAEGGRAIDAARFLELADPGAERGEGQHFGVATGPDHGWAAVGVAWRRPDAGIQVMVVDYRPGTEWVAGRVAELRAVWGGPVVCNTAAKGLLPKDLQAETPEWEQAAADNAIVDAVKAGTVRHGNQGELITAVRNAAWRQSSSAQAQTFEERGEVDISPLVAVALAHKSVADSSAEAWGFFE